MNYIKHFFGFNSDFNVDSDLNQDFQNESKSKKSIALLEDELFVSGDELFFTLQGEGRTIGAPAVFLRLQVCNLSCKWCDTPYTWQPKSNSFWIEPKQKKIEQLVVEINNLWSSNTNLNQKRLVITGGEPLLQQDRVALLTQKLGRDWVIEIETNATIIPNKYLQNRCKFNCSPKLSHSENSNSSRINSLALKKLKNLDSIFKFVVSEESDLREMDTHFVKPFSLPLENVYVMPLCYSSKQAITKMQQLVPLIKPYGYRLSPRLHLLLFKERRKT